MPGGLDPVENIGPDDDVRYVKGRTPRRPEMCPRCFGTDTVMFDDVRLKDGVVISTMTSWLCRACCEVYDE